MNVLTDRQVEILALVASGMSFHTVGGLLHLSRHTVRNQMVMARERLGASNLNNMIAVAVAEDIIHQNGSGGFAAS